ncbi:MAG: nuclease-related domain-containing protein [Desulfuromonadaceae bacterium]|nr:nuclease-related domain-containing protein [Desulfuromonadaceae bacterium]MDD2848658.1 nuclease-related domain-containing protein [Desulfuromonadaceae bacterium]MDD4130839.1 nuclease-related domain-containing protein [Desulfuromonadaceae bacterium]
MSQQHGNAGQGARIMAFKRDLIVLGCALGMFFIAWQWMKNAASISALGLPAIIALIVAFKFLLNKVEKKTKYVKKRAKDADRGAAAEVKVAATMAELPEGFTAFHDLAFSGFNIDHVVIGTSGIFLVETKSHGGKVTTEGDKLLLNGNPTDKDFINQTWSQTYQLKSFLKEQTGKEYQVKPVLCFSKAFVQLRQAIKGVAVVNSKFLNELLQRQKPLLSSEDLKAVSAALKAKSV